MKYNLKNSTILSGKVLLLLSIVFIFSYVNIYYDKLEKAEFEKSKKDNDMEYSNIEDYDNIIKSDTIEGFVGKKERIQYFEQAKNGKCILQFSAILKIPIWILKILFKIIIWLLKFLYRPFRFILKSLLGEYFDIIAKVLQTIYMIYEKILYYFFWFATILFRIIISAISIVFRVIFAIIPNIILNLLSIILSLPFVIFAFLKPFFRIFNFLKIICWSRNGIIYDLKWLRSKILSFDFTSLL